VRSIAAPVADSFTKIAAGESHDRMMADDEPVYRNNKVRRHKFHQIALMPRVALFSEDANSKRSIPKNVAIGTPSYVQPERHGVAHDAVKRAADFVVSICLLVFLFPVLALIAAAIKLDSSGPVFFRQSRNGIEGRTFRILKFRTMRVCEDDHAVTQAQRNDPRVTQLGRFLRRNSLDELPQLLNVLFGEMSLVGPRPHAQVHDEFYARQIDNYLLRQHVKPGITGWAQVNGFRGETQTVDQMSRRVEMDLWYVSKCSFLLDCKILLLTVREVLKQTNAY
jgi:exopolysaccharide biosynthesis polyprenyl glycosylphosphotransferase